MRYLRTFGFAMLGVVLFTLAWNPNSAQVDCPALSISALENFKMLCGDTGGGQLCIGGNAQVETQADASTTVPTTPLRNISAVQTLPYDPQVGEAGLAQLTVPANVPLSLSASGLHYILMGEVRVENNVAVASALQPAEPITVATVVGSNLRSFPSTDGRIVNSAPVGAQLQADAVSRDGGWFRVFFEDQSAWISRQIVVVQEGDASTLPTISDDTRTLMQSITLTTGSAEAECDTVTPAFLIVQAPGGMSAEIVVNGAPIRFTDAIALRTTAANTLQLFVIEGGASSDGLSVPAGFTMQLPLSADNRQRDGFWGGLRPISSAERSVVGVVGLLPADVIYRPLSVPSQAEVTALLQQINQASAGQGSAASSGSLNCTGFRPTSPLDAIVNGETVFFWDGVQGADSYRLNIFDENGGRRGGGTIDGFNTTLALNTGVAALGDAGGFSWNVEALVGGDVACTSGRVNVVRVNVNQPVADDGGGGGGGDGGQPQPEPTPCLWNQC